MKKYSIISGLCLLTALSGCGLNADKSEVYDKSGHTINVSDRNELYNKNGILNEGEKMSNFGYVRHQKSPVPGDANVYETLPKMDREAVADLISKICTQLPNVNDVGTLVTDEEVLVAYDTDSDNRMLTADQVKRSALSAVPRYYHVYVSDDPSMIKDIERFGTLDSNSRDIDQILDSTIQKMLKSPQGYKISEGENANGETEGELNPRYERKMKDQRINTVNPREHDVDTGDVQNGTKDSEDFDQKHPE